MKNVKQQIVDHRSVAVFGSEEEKKFVATNFKQAIDLQMRLQQTEKEAASTE